MDRPVYLALRNAKAGRMIDQMDKAMLALQSSAAGRNLYGPQHPAIARQLDLAVQVLGEMLTQAPRLRVVCLDNTLLFQDTALPSNPQLTAALIPKLAAHGIEWLEFRNGLTRADLLSLVEQLERPHDQPASIGAQYIRVGVVGRKQDATAPQIISGTDTAQQAAQLQEIWEQLRSGEPADERLGEIVENIRLAVVVGADICKQLALVKSHDEYTFVHTVNVGVLSAALGEAIGMNSRQVFELTLAALLHDVGKQQMPPAILNKAGKLDDEERRQIERHTLDGAAMLFGNPNVPDVAPIVAFEHHANIDGTGYPRLPHRSRPHLASQIVHIADVFDALRTNRPYRAALDEATVLKILTEGAGKSFDPALVDLFLRRIVKANAA
jgi:HD-GYP domain-containing protein (c-di-GMP phosphodiesterase class II)